MRKATFPVSRIACPCGPLNGRVWVRGLQVAKVLVAFFLVTGESFREDVWGIEVGDRDGTTDGARVNGVV